MARSVTRRKHQESKQSQRLPRCRPVRKKTGFQKKEDNSNKEGLSYSKRARDWEGDGGEGKKWGAGEIRGE